MKEQCSKMVSGEGQWGAFHQHQCHKKAVVVRDGVPLCKIHDPEYIKSKNIALQEKWEAEWKVRKDVNHRNLVIRDIISVLDNIPTADIEANTDGYKSALIDASVSRTDKH